MRKLGKGYTKTKHGKYQVRIVDLGQQRHIGCYDTREAAHSAYINACEERLSNAIARYGHRMCDGVVYKNNYIVFDNGDIFELTGYKMSTYQKGGYLSCMINGRDERVHRILAICFIPNPYNKPEVNHINGIRYDNHLGNLEWVTHRENVQHAYDTGLTKPGYGEELYNAKLSCDDVTYIRNNYIPRDPEFGQAALSRKFGVSQKTVYAVIHNKTWTHCPNINKYKGDVQNEY